MRILVAEDDAPLADFLCQELQKEQFAVPVVADGIEAQELALNQHYILSFSPCSPWRHGLGSPARDSLQKAGPSVLIVTAAAKVEERVRGWMRAPTTMLRNPSFRRALRAHSRGPAAGQPPGASRTADRGSRARTRHHAVQSCGHEIALSPKNMRSLNSHAQCGAARFPRRDCRASLEV